MEVVYEFMLVLLELKAKKWLFQTHYEKRDNVWIPTKYTTMILMITEQGQ